MNRIHPNWAPASLGDLTEIIAGVGFPEHLQGDSNAEIPVFKVGDISSAAKRGQIRLAESANNISAETAQQLSSRLVPPDTVVFAKIGAAIGLNRRALTTRPCLVDNNVMGLVPRKDLVEPLFLYYFSSTLALMEYARATTVPSIRKGDVASIIAPVPSLSEQRRIVEAIELYFTRLDDAVATLERVERNLKRYRASVLKAAVEGRLVPTEAALAKKEGRSYEPASVLLERILAERRRRWSESGKKGKYQEPLPPDTSKLPNLPEGWCWATLNSLADIQLGQQRAPVHAAAETQIPYVRAANITWAGLDLSDVKSMGFPNPERYKLEYGDVLLSEASGSPMEAGKPAIWKDEIAGACYQKTLLRIRPFCKALVLPAFLRAIFLRDCLTGKFARLAPGVGIVHLTAERMIEWPVPLAPVSEQRRITSEVDRLESAIDASATSVARQSVRCQGLRQSILKWAFEGKLADQDPDDEPASVLLERIKAERGAVDPRRHRQQRGAGKKQVRA